MKIKLILTVFAFAIASFSFGQSDKAQSANKDLKAQALKLTEQMTSYLELDENQVERMKGLNMSLMKRKEDLKEMNVSEDEMAEKMAAFEERHNATVKQVLNEEQYKKFEAKYGNMEEMKKQKAKK